GPAVHSLWTAWSPRTFRVRAHGRADPVRFCRRSQMYVSHLQLADYRSYGTVNLELEPGISTFVGPNGQGKTNLVEAVGYVATHSSHRVAHDAPLVRRGAQRAIIRTAVVRHDQRTLIELEINPGRANRARLN